MSDDKNPMHAGHRRPARLGRPGELLFSFTGANGRQIECRLRYHDGHGVEAAFLEDGEFTIARTFPVGWMALAWADSEREHIEKGDQ